ncbi:MAG TPA: SRPBCC family protein [Streptosporangiaceae bacterium]|jgi:uncharacterized protein YndB with AHSA1/START domain
MTPVVETIEISRRPEDVFSYATDFAHFPEWQGALSVSKEGDATPAVGSKARVSRRVGPREMTRTEEITELVPPKSWTTRGVGGPVTAIAKGSIEPLDDGERSRVTIALDFEGHGIGKLLVPLLIRRQAQRDLPKNGQRLKDVLERQR